MLRSSHSGVRRTFLSYSDCFGDYAYGLLPLFQVALYSVQHDYDTLLALHGAVSDT